MHFAKTALTHDSWTRYRADLRVGLFTIVYLVSALNSVSNFFIPFIPLESTRWKQIVWSRPGKISFLSVPGRIHSKETSALMRAFREMDQIHSSVMPGAIFYTQLLFRYTWQCKWYIRLQISYSFTFSWSTVDIVVSTCACPNSTQVKIRPNTALPEDFFGWENHTESLCNKAELCLPLQAVFGQSGRTWRFPCNSGTVTLT